MLRRKNYNSNVIPVQTGIQLHICNITSISLQNTRNGTLYIGVTNNLIKRVHEHKNGLVDGFTKKYTINMLVYFETTEDIQSAITREKQLKKWERNWKLALIEKKNPEWRDLCRDLL